MFVHQWNKSTWIAEELPHSPHRRFALDPSHTVLWTERETRRHKLTTHRQSLEVFRYRPAGKQAKVVSRYLQAPGTGVPKIWMSMSHVFFPSQLWGEMELTDVIVLLFQMFVTDSGHLFLMAFSLWCWEQCSSSPHVCSTDSTTITPLSVSRSMTQKQRLERFRAEMDGFYNRRCRPQLDMKRI